MDLQFVKFNAREKKLFDSFAKFFKISLSVYVTKYSDVRI